MIRAGTLPARSNVRRSIIGAFALLVTAFAAAGAASPARADLLSLGQPANVGEAKIAATAYRASGKYDRDLSRVSAAAGAWIALRAPQVSRPAVVFDIDDTLLTNWEVIKADDFGRVFGGPCSLLPEGPCGWVAWDLRGKTPAIPQTVAVYRKARALGAAVFFISGRDETQRTATERNLRLVGLGDYSRLILVAKGAHYASAADFKAPQRAAIEAAGYRIIANIGDQPSDLAGGHAERTFQLPNPFYRIP
ncbi:acid phosphatase [Starkeya sp. ORNL1]|uniref:HAD family acid phosphatase n=1 Tax=Starkeya sp. ORNL1 TaxID=2709380 RepID=UPI001463B6E0|nr:HAD family acid phosphatase [Starkeya sp. ORNL1]QJP12782.1 acid phosphatase [Starkeya sp. ORNL1]